MPHVCESADGGILLCFRLCGKEGNVLERPKGQGTLSLGEFDFVRGFMLYLRHFNSTPLPLTMRPLEEIIEELVALSAECRWKNGERREFSVNKHCSFRKIGGAEHICIPLSVFVPWALESLCANPSALLARNSSCYLRGQFQRRADQILDPRPRVF